MNPSLSNQDTFCQFRGGNNNNVSLASHLPSLPAPEPVSAQPITPPATETDPEDEQALLTALHVLSTEARALENLSQLYATSPIARDGFVRAVEAISTATRKGAKTVVIAVGKSGKIGEKVVATMNSLSLTSMFMHPVEALHGDLGVVGPNDVLLLITFSGNTPELLSLLPHLPMHSPLVALTSHTSHHTSRLTRERTNAILLPAPIPESEEMSFGILAPTTSTTVALALGDALVIAVARRVHARQGTTPKDVFRRNHPGGAIGLKSAKEAAAAASVDSPPGSESDLDGGEWMHGTRPPRSWAGASTPAGDGTCPAGGRLKRARDDSYDAQRAPVVGRHSLLP